MTTNKPASLHDSMKNISSAKKKMNKKIISYSLYGTQKHYRSGALLNVKLQKKIYPDWICRFYVSDEIPNEFIAQLKNLGAEVVNISHKYPNMGLYWRFLAIDDLDVAVMIVRDTDSLLSFREKEAVDEWLKSKKGFHIMRDHPLHKVPILGGMWGVQKNVLPSMFLLLKQWKCTYKKGEDQEFLMYKVYPLIQDNLCIHAEYIRFMGESTLPFPSPRVGTDFVGSVKTNPFAKPFENELTLEFLKKPLQTKRFCFRTLFLILFYRVALTFGYKCFAQTHGNSFFKKTKSKIRQKRGAL
ncbi:tpr repeat [hydrocarbon metagenome]|uniref:Tpr repeat n=1 Tax=hydrocarbon metagenome TaxID=938273 RepID=A0A0W8FML1_9ZZZZ